jgi:hypothetical protein
MQKSIARKMKCKTEEDRKTETFKVMNRDHKIEISRNLKNETVFDVVTRTTELGRVLQLVNSANHATN